MLLRRNLIIRIAQWCRNKNNQYFSFGKSKFSLIVRYQRYLFVNFSCLFLGLVFYILKQFPNNNNVEEIIKYIASIVQCDHLGEILDLITGLTKRPSTQWGLIHNLLGMYSPGIYLFKVSNGITKTMCEIHSRLRIKIPEWRQWRRSGVFIIDFDEILRIVLVFSLLSLKRSMLAGLSVSMHGDILYLSFMGLTKSFLEALRKIP